MRSGDDRSAWQALEQLGKTSARGTLRIEYDEEDPVAQAQISAVGAPVAARSASALARRYPERHRVTTHGHPHAEQQLWKIEMERTVTRHGDCARRDEDSRMYDNDFCD
ncbi:hypothetical protein [Nonomuraea dietziae]|uniref:hypothetical protein n=1 Tax=Nonomuraea dietziae TaxID=65515 RepID=UPI0031D23A25